MRHIMRDFKSKSGFSRRFSKSITQNMHNFFIKGIGQWHMGGIRNKLKLPKLRLPKIKRPAGRAMMVWGIIGLMATAPLYYGVGAIKYDRVDDNMQYQSSITTENGSKMVDMIASLLSREVVENPWIPNDQPFMPSAFLDNTPNYQIGMQKALKTATLELKDRLARNRGVSMEDKSLDEAFSSISEKPDLWLLGTEQSTRFGATSEKAYKNTIEHLKDYNKRVSANTATFDPRTDNIVGYLDRVALDLGAISSQVDEHMHGTKDGKKAAASAINTINDDLFYENKGTLYVHYMLLRELRTDALDVLKDTRSLDLYDQMLEHLAHAAELSPMVVINGKGDSQFLPSHLAAQDRELLEARAKLREITSTMKM